MKVINHAPPNSIIFISDVDGGEPPEHLDDSLVHFSRSCVSVGCFMEIDGETEIALGAADEIEAKAGFEAVFDGMIDTPTRTLMVSDLDIFGLMSSDVPGDRTRVRIWVNDPQMPDKIVIGWG